MLDVRRAIDLFYLMAYASRCCPSKVGHFIQMNQIHGAASRLASCFRSLRLGSFYKNWNWRNWHVASIVIVPRGHVQFNPCICLSCAVEDLRQRRQTERYWNRDSWIRPFGTERWKALKAIKSCHMQSFVFAFRSSSAQRRGLNCCLNAEENCGRLMIEKY